MRDGRGRGEGRTRKEMFKQEYCTPRAADNKAANRCPRNLCKEARGLLNDKFGEGKLTILVKYYIIIMLAGTKIISHNLVSINSISNIILHAYYVTPST